MYGKIRYLGKHAAFTFHNVSINSGTVPLNKVVNIVFTFHNVSINSTYEPPAAGSTDKFTFHNVSINSWDKEQYTDYMYEFTFHNVSINSYIDILEEDDEEHLHSIMYLLILSLVVKIKDASQIYIP